VAGSTTGHAASQQYASTLGHTSGERLLEGWALLELRFGQLFRRELLEHSESASNPEALLASGRLTRGAPSFSSRNFHHTFMPL
jgi:hypothetical protein